VPYKHIKYQTTQVYRWRVSVLQYYHQTVEEETVLSDVSLSRGNVFLPKNIRLKKSSHQRLQSLQKRLKEWSKGWSKNCHLFQRNCTHPSPRPQWGSWWSKCSWKLQLRSPWSKGRSSSQQAPTTYWPRLALHHWSRNSKDWSCSRHCQKLPMTQGST
jgi:hypothetical protein